MVLNVLLGGFLFNDQLLKFIPLTTSQNSYLFIDINKFIPPFDLSIITSLVYDEIVNMMIFMQQQINPKQDNLIINLMAYSTGGLIAIKLINLLPNMFNHLILLNSSASFMMNQNKLKIEENNEQQNVYSRHQKQYYADKFLNCSNIDNSWCGISQVNLNKLYDKLTKLSLIDFKCYFTKLAALPFKLPSSYINNIYSHHINKDNLLSWLDIINETDTRAKFTNIQIPILSVYSNYDNLVSCNNINLNNKYNKIIILPNSSHIFFAPTDQNIINNIICKKELNDNIDS